MGDAEYEEISELCRKIGLGDVQPVFVIARDGDSDRGFLCWWMNDDIPMEERRLILSAMYALVDKHRG